jgi:hypothetical protein
MPPPTRVKTLGRSRWQGCQKYFFDTTQKIQYKLGS